jgi:hypothetical protein
MTKQDHPTLLDKHVFETFINPGEVVEIRIPHTEGTLDGKRIWGTASGYFDDHGKFCEAVKKAETLRHEGIYFTLQVIDPRLLARAFNRLKVKGPTTSDNNVLAYRWLPLDFDPVRPSGASKGDQLPGNQYRETRPFRTAYIEDLGGE